jgi:hypothetical protein
MVFRLDVGSESASDRWIMRRSRRVRRATQYCRPALRLGKTLTGCRFSAKFDVFERSYGPLSGPLAAASSKRLELLFEIVNLRRVARVALRDAASLRHHKDPRLVRDHPASPCATRPH